MIMAPSPGRSALTNTILSFRAAEDSIRQRQQHIHRETLTNSAYVREPNYRSIHARDLEFLFRTYDAQFLEGLMSQALDGRRLTFRLAPRLTRAGGKTFRIQSPMGEVRFEIAIATAILFDSFREADRQITVCGLACANRLEGLQRIFEHELVHLAEQLCWDQSNCSAARFQDIAGRLFLHRSHTHDLVTRRERAAASGIRTGTRVTFTFEGVQLTGRVNRITKRATVLVEDPEGLKYSDGGRYKSYYVPIGLLRPVAATPQ
jgi:hypothetical protein